jgi:hypothetical protein
VISIAAADLVGWLPHSADKLLSSPYFVGSLSSSQSFRRSSRKSCAKCTTPGNIRSAIWRSCSPFHALLFTAPSLALRRREPAREADRRYARKIHRHHELRGPRCSSRPGRMIGRQWPDLDCVRDRPRGIATRGTCHRINRIEQRVQVFCERLSRPVRGFELVGGDLCRPFTRNSRRYGPYSPERAGNVAACALAISCAQIGNHISTTWDPSGILTGTICAPRSRRTRRANSMAAACPGSIPLSA